MLWLSAEFFVLYLLIPTLADHFIVQFRRLLFPTLIGGSILLWWVLRRDATFDRRLLFNARALGRWWWRILLLVALFVPIAYGAVMLTSPDALLHLPRERRALWIAIIVLYPVLSVYPQEIIFRTWLFHRYRSLFCSRWATIAASAAAFGYAHIMFDSPIALLMTLVGGVVFARTYERSRSTFVVAIEHALYGVVIFTIGLGRHFYLGAAGS